MQQRQRVGHHARGKHLFCGDLAALLRIRIERAIEPVLHGDGGQVGGRAAPLVNETGSSHRVHRRKHHARACVQSGLVVIELQRNGAAAELGQLLDTEDQHAAVLTGHQCMARQVHGRGTAGTGVFDVVDRDALETEVADDDLTKDHASEHVGAIDGVDVAQIGPSVFQCAKDGLLCQFRGLHANMAAKRRHGHAVNVCGCAHLNRPSFAASRQTGIPTPGPGWLRTANPRQGLLRARTLRTPAAVPASQRNPVHRRQRRSWDSGG
ncbi:hypothetical protein D9M68_720140 [compost metagenome]